MVTVVVSLSDSILEYISPDNESKINLVLGSDLNLTSDIRYNFSYVLLHKWITEPNYFDGRTINLLVASLDCSFAITSDCNYFIVTACINRGYMDF